MCNFFWIDGRTVRTASERLGILDDAIANEPFAEGWREFKPTNKVPAIFADGVRVCRWSLIPKWVKVIPKSIMTNARAETLREKPSFRGLLKDRRCIIPAGGFFEWPSKVKTSITRADGEPMCFAGLWDEWHGGEGDEPVRSVTIVTTAPSDWMRRIHDRMPLILSYEEAEVWLNGEKDEAMALTSVHDPDLEADPEPVGALF